MERVVYCTWELTDDSNVGEHWECATPRDRTKIGPLHIHLSGCASQKLIQNSEDNKPNYLRQNPGRDSQALDNKV
jgi:hypothetical protein